MGFKNITRAVQSTGFVAATLVATVVPTAVVSSPASALDSVAISRCIRAVSASQVNVRATFTNGSKTSAGIDFDVKGPGFTIPGISRNIASGTSYTYDMGPVPISGGQSRYKINGIWSGWTNVNTYPYCR